MKKDFPGAFKSWTAMHNRTKDTHRHNAESYVSKGIKVCERWKVFSNFVADMGERPDGLMFERKDRDGNYEPSNCKWDTMLNQQRNRSNNKLTLEKAISIASQKFSGGSDRTIAHKFGIARSMVWSIMRQKAWPDALPEAMRLCYHPQSSI